MQIEDPYADTIISTTLAPDRPATQVIGSKAPRAPKIPHHRDSPRISAQIPEARVLTGNFDSEGEHKERSVGPVIMREQELFEKPSQVTRW
jgi:hypothetical protein